MIKTVIRGHHYTPGEIDALFIDGQDHHGIEWLYEDLKEIDDEINKIKRKK